MLFNSIQFLIFFPVVTVLYFLIPAKFRWLHLLVASCVFYMGFIPVYILILFFTIIIDYIAGIMIENAHDRRRKKTFLILSIVANVGVLAVFKYYNFFIDNVNQLLHSWNIESYDLPFLNIILPIGLSFHTFQAMSYTIEVYRGNQAAEKHFGVYALYVMYYPQLVAGPIERPQNILHQLKEEKKFDYDRITAGLKLMAWGFFKKVVVADNLAGIVNNYFAAPEQYNGAAAVIAVIFFSFQIYCDFSGYSDIAIGSSQVMGIRLMQNFRQPYLSKSISEFWKRWHISLSTWFRDYLYIPLGGNRVSVGRVYFNLFFVFLVSGLWHGANWTFVIWGALHGLFLVTGILLTKRKRIFDKSVGIHPYLLNLKSFAWILGTFVLVAFAWIFFRAESVGDAFNVIRSVLSIQLSPAAIKQGFVQLNIDMYHSILYFLLIVFLLITEVLQEKESIVTYISEKRPVIRWSAYFLVVGVIIFIGIWGDQQFIYFQF
jgi:alginate O-acetyltransferase complex protein AlgI